MNVPVDLSINGKESYIQASLILPTQYQSFPFVLKSNIALECNFDLKTPTSGINNIYLIHCDKTQHYKIGSHSDPLEKLKELQVGCPLKLELIACCPGNKSVEESLTYKYKDNWFVLDDAEARNIIDDMTSHYFISRGPMIQKEPQTPRPKGTKLMNLIKRMVPDKDLNQSNNSTE